MKIIRKEENKLLGRTEVKAEIVSEGATPSRQEIKKQIAKEVKADEKNVIVQKIDSAFGSGIVIVYANIYAKDKELQETTSEYIKKRHQKEVKAEEGASEAPATEAAPSAEGDAAAPEEAKTEESKSEEENKEEASEETESKAE